MMTQDKPVWDANVPSVTIRALSSIRPEQAEIITRAVHAAQSGWDVQTTHDYDGYLSILIALSSGGDQQNAFFVGGTAQRLELFEMHSDDMTLVGAFDNAEKLSDHVIALIARR